MSKNTKAKPTSPASTRRRAARRAYPPYREPTQADLWEQGYSTGGPDIPPPPGSQDYPMGQE